MKVAADRQITVQKAIHAQAAASRLMSFASLAGLYVK